MNWKNIAILALMLVFGYGCCTTAAESEVVIKYRDPPHIYKSVVALQAPRIDKPNAFVLAAGFAVNNEYLITAGHFCSKIKEEPNIKEEIHLYALNNNDEIVGIGIPVIVKYEMERDLCLLKLPGHGIVPLDIVKRYRKNVRRGDHIRMLGSPLGVFPAETDGRVINPYDSDDQLAMSAPAYKGNSGGPVLNDDGQLIGVAVVVNMMYHHLSFATPAHLVRKFLKENKVQID